MTMHAGRVLAELLVNHGVDVVFGVPGGQTLALYDGIHALKPRLRHILMRDERSAAYAADGYARVTGRVGVCDATVGPGATKLPSGLGEALNSSVPILAIVSDLNQAWTTTRYRGAASQAVDQVAMLTPLCKWIASAEAPQALPDLVRTAFARATSGRPGPVVLNVPEDVFLAEVAEGSLDLGADPTASLFPRERPRPDPEAVRRAAEILVRAERPLLLVGGGAHLSGAEAEVRALAELLGLPVATTFSGKGILGEGHPLAVGVLGLFGTQAARALAEEADVVLHVGCKSAQNSTFLWTLPRPGQTLIHLDIDPVEPGKVLPTAVALLGDAKAGLQDLIRCVQEILPEPRLRLDRRTRIREVKTRWEAFILPELQASDIPILPQRVMADLQAAFGPEDVLVCDASFPSGWGAVFFSQATPGRRCLFPRGLAGLGFGLPAAIGVRIARAQGAVFCLAGDGGFAYSLGELATLTRQGLKVICIVLNNRSLAWVQYLQRIQFGGRYESVEFPDMDFAKVAEGLGCRGMSVERPDELKGAIAEALRGEEAVVLDVKTAVWETPILPYREAVDRERKEGRS